MKYIEKRMAKIGGMISNALSASGSNMGHIGMGDR